MDRARPDLRDGTLNAAASSRLLLALSVLTALTLGSCKSVPALTVEAQVQGGVITPNGDPLRSTTILRYTLSAPAQVSVSIQDAAGQRYSLRSAEARPAAGNYQLTVDGTHADAAGPMDRRVLPDGKYQLVVDAVDRTGQQASASTQLTVEGADTNAPRLDPLVITPKAISPNFDAIDDVATATFRLSKEAFVSIYALDSAGNTVDVRLLDERRPVGEYVEFWDGVVNETPLGDGIYHYVVTARDRAGNVTGITTPIQVAAGGIPRAKILRADFSPHQILLGGDIAIRIRIKNTGDTVMRTQGPDPGFTYSSYDSFGSIANGEFIDRAGLWRAGVDWAGSPISGGARYPYRWGFGHDLRPGEEVEIAGNIQVWHRITKMFFVAGIIQEGVRIQDDGVGRAQIEVSF